MTNDVELTAQAVAASIKPMPSTTLRGLTAPNSSDVTDAVVDVTIRPPISRDDVTRSASGRRWLGLLREHDFRQLFIADSGSQLGTQVGMLALPLVAAVTLHATAFEMGVVSAADTLVPTPTLELVEQRFGFLPEIRRPELFRDNPFAAIYDIGRTASELGVRPRGNWRNMTAEAGPR